MPTARSLRDDIVNAFDFFQESELVLFTATVAMSPSRVTWHTPTTKPFVIDSQHPSVGEYLSWVKGGHYSAVLPDASLVQLTYDLEGATVVRHRLAYVPCPVLVDETLLAEEPIVDVVETYLAGGVTDALTLRSPLRFDFDLGAARSHHPAAHLTVNSAHCRIACIAPVHPYRFLDFVYRHFYPRLWWAQQRWFEGAAGRLLGERVLSDEDAAGLHVVWPQHGRAAA